MDLDRLEDSKAVRLAAGLAALIICLAILLSFVLDRSLDKVSASLTSSSVVVEHTDDIVDSLDRLMIDQRAFLTTGQDCFSADMVRSVGEIIRHLEWLKQMPDHGETPGRQIAQLSRSVDGVLKVVGESNDLQHSSGTAVALALLDGDGDTSLQAARMDAIKLKRIATDRVFYRVGLERDARTLLDALF